MNKDKLIRFRLDEYDYKELKKYSDRTGKTVSKVLRDELMEKIYKENERHINKNG